MKINDVEFYNKIRNFLEIHIIRQKKFSANTQKSYREALSLLLVFFRETMNLSYEKLGFEYMDYTNISNFLDWIEVARACSASTTNQRLMAIKSFLKYCAAVDPSKIALQAEIQKIPLRKVQQKVVEFLSETAMKVMVEQVDETTRTGIRDKTLILLMYDTGARCQEILDIKLGSLDLRKTNPQVGVCGKGNKNRLLPISSEIVTQLQIYLDKYHPVATRSSDDYLFYTVIHGLRHQMSPDAVALFLRNYSAKGHAICAELPEGVRPHQIRHSRAMHLYRSGLPQVLLSEFLGHANPVTTKVYAWSDTEMKRNAIAKAKPVKLLNEGEQPIWKNNETLIKKLYGLN